MSDMRMAISILNKIQDNYSRQWEHGSKPNHKGIPLTSERWLYTNPYYAIRPYLNGREQGFAIEVSGGKIRGHKLSYEDRKIVIFSENRRSDDLVVYIGVASDFDTENMNPHFVFKSERKYFEQATYFSPSKMDEALEFIEKALFDTQIEEDEEVLKMDIERDLRLEDERKRNCNHKKCDNVYCGT